MNVAFSILGPLEVRIDDVDVTPRAPKERALLAMLVVNRGHVVGVERLMEELWPSLAADRARRVLQVRMAGLRKRLDRNDAGPLLEFVPPGYRLAVGPEAVDEHRFSALVQRARAESEAGHPARAAATLREALGVWRDEPLADVAACVTLEVEASRLRDARLNAIEERVEAELACGLHHALVSELDALVSAHPLRERFWAQRVLALYRCGRQAEALRACSALRRRLAEELGVEPIDVMTDEIQDFLSGALPPRSVGRWLRSCSSTS